MGFLGIPSPGRLSELGMWWRGKCGRFIFSLRACRESFWTGPETGNLLAVWD
jgi:hypothetical protein